MTRASHRAALEADQRTRLRLAIGILLVVTLSVCRVAVQAAEQDPRAAMAQREGAR